MNDLECGSVLFECLVKWYCQLLWQLMWDSYYSKSYEHFLAI